MCVGIDLKKKQKMKKIVIPFSGDQFSEGAFEFARHLNELAPVLLTGVFLPEIYYPGDFGFSGAGALEIPALIPFLDSAFDDETEENIVHFRELCIKHNIDHRIHSATSGVALPQLIKETRFADLVIVGSETFYQTGLDNAAASDNLPSLLHKSESPVLVVPEQYEFPENVVLAYDGSKSSVFAIKQFAYLMPELSCKSTLLVYAANPDKPIPDMYYIKELAARHFNDLTILKLEADAHKYFETMMLDKRSPLLVAGAYDRSQFSNLFKKSFASDLINDFLFPVFIAHC